MSFSRIECVVHERLLVSGPPLKRPALEVDLYGWTAIGNVARPLTSVAVGQSTPLQDVMTTPILATDQSGLKASHSCFQDGVIHAFVYLPLVMAHILSYAALLSDRRDFVNRGVVQVVPVKFRCLLAKVRVVGFRRRPVRAIPARTGIWTT